MFHVKLYQYLIVRFLSKLKIRFLSKLLFFFLFFTGNKRGRTIACPYPELGTVAERCKEIFYPLYFQYNGKLCLMIEVSQGLRASCALWGCWECSQGPCWFLCPPAKTGEWKHRVQLLIVSQVLQFVSLQYFDHFRKKGLWKFTCASSIYSCCPALSVSGKV